MISTNLQYNRVALNQAQSTRFGVDTRGSLPFQPLLNAADRYASATDRLSSAQQEFNAASSQFNQELVNKDYTQHDVRVNAGQVIQRLKERMGTADVVKMIQDRIDAGTRN